ncbi:hypothetical protein PUNSTDRAFT_137921 [Punctularia strigosozonata HHB-11173 SS5]|uniref:Uncharacterized protein n=1 Tax=Punctularia strigosozonata (strain HHB-11173) TaxID=741275 RepID=R7S4U2_PUNST|nr:uncharacterized protein PUNSTDRAFT_137921 [Punctularia strigosozonata HHB-11173 SS5]EIN05238.1 hypothetical protein PUNSTDRAFT_137921 [Punctularia strigosozonata HHB-11173 SS5]
MPVRVPHRSSGKKSVQLDSLDLDDGSRTLERSCEGFRFRPSPIFVLLSSLDEIANIRVSPRSRPISLSWNTWVSTSLLISFDVLARSGVVEWLAGKDTFSYTANNRSLHQYMHAFGLLLDS